MNINEMFPSKYLKGTDLVDKHVNVTIEGVSYTDEFDEGRKYVLSFKGAKKLLMLNKTNVGILQWLFPEVDDTAGWIGREVQLYAELVSFKGKTGPAVRIRGTQSVMAAATAPLEPSEVGVRTDGGGAPVQPGTSGPVQSFTSQPQTAGPGEQAAAQSRAQLDEHRKEVDRQGALAGEDHKLQSIPTDPADLDDEIPF